MALFFFSENPIALFLALVLVIALLKIFLGKHRWFQGDYAPYVTLILIIAIILLVAYRKILEIISYATPFIALLIIFVFALGVMYFVLGRKEDGMWGVLKGIGPLKTALQIAVICFIALAISRVYGDQLLDKPSVSITDPLIAEEEPVEIDFGPVFTRQALGMILLLIVMGFGFFFVNFSR